MRNPLPFAGLLALVIAGAPPPAAAAEAGVALAETSDHARALEISRRLMGPVTHDRLLRYMQAHDVAVREHDVDPGAERYEIVLPSTRPPGGYGVMVFVAPQHHFPLTSDFRRELDRRGFIYIAAYASGNDQNVYRRRVPLALHGLAHVVANHPVDPARIHVSGFSGGSRVALRLASGFPDLFSSVMLVGGSDPIGQHGYSPPPPELMERFQTHTRIVIATGREDGPNRGKDGRTRESFEAYCVAGVTLVLPPRVGHEMPYGRYLAQAMDAMEVPVTPTDADDACRADLLQRVSDELDAAQESLEAGRHADAAERLQSIDARFGGLASPRIEALVRRLDAEYGAGVPGD